MEEQRQAERVNSRQFRRARLWKFAATKPAVGDIILQCDSSNQKQSRALVTASRRKAIAMHRAKPETNEKLSVCRVPIRPVKKERKAKLRWNGLANRRQQFHEKAPHSIAKDKMQLPFQGLEIWKDELLEQANDDINGIATPELTDKDARANFFAAYRQIGDDNTHNDTSTVRYLKSCEQSRLLPLPVLDFVSGNRQQRINANGKIEFDNYYFGGSRAAALASATQTLPMEIKHLAMKNTGLNDSAAIALSGILQDTNIEQLDFSSNKIGLKGCQHVAKALSVKTNLVMLNLAENSIGDLAASSLFKVLLNRCTLQTLNLRGNRLCTSIQLLADILRQNRSLVDLDISWNAIQGQSAIKLATSIDENTTLTTLNISDNTFCGPEQAVEHLAASLRTNRSLTNLNVSNNRISVRPILVFCDMLVDNDTLKTIYLNGNPIGSTGNAAVFRLLAEGQHNAVINMSNCLIETEHELGAFHYINCAGVYRIALSNQYDRCIGRAIVSKVANGQGTVVQSRYGGAAFPINQEIASQGDVVPHTGRWTFKFVNSRHASLGRKMTDESFKVCKHSLSISFALDDKKKSCAIKQLAVEYSFTIEQVNQLLELYTNDCDTMERADVAVALLLQLAEKPHSSICPKDSASLNPKTFFEDKDNDGLIDVCGDICMMKGIKSLSDFEQSYVEQKLQKWILFNQSNPNGSYRLNLGNSIERLIMMRILEACHEDKSYRTENSLMDISQHGDHFALRNVMLNHIPFHLTSTWIVANTGTIVFDLHLTKRPEKDCIALNPNAFDLFLNELKALETPPSSKILGIRNISTMYYFTSRQVQRVMEHFPAHEKDEFGDSYRSLAFVVLHSRVVDELQIDLALSILDRLSRRKLLNKFGVFNLFNPLKPCGQFELELEHCDHRRLLSVYVILTQRREGYATAIFYNNSEIEFPASWSNEAQLPRHGTIKFKFITANKVKHFENLPEHSYRRYLTNQLYDKYRSNMDT